MSKLLHRRAIWFIAVIIFVGCLLRLLYINQVPSGISDDELDYVMTARSVLMTGKTLDGLYAPFSFKQVPQDIQAPYAKAPYMLMAPFSVLASGNLGSSKIPYALVSVLSIFVITMFAWRMWGPNIAVITGFIAAFNPWGIHFGRTAFDTPLAILFAYIFILCLFTLKRWWILVSIIPWIIGVYSYQGTIIIFPFILVIGCVGAWMLSGNRRKKPLLATAVLGLALFTVFLFQFATDRTGTRISDLALPNSSVITAQVDNIRRKSVQVPTNSLFTNRYTVAIHRIIGQYVESFSTRHLFVTGDERSTFSVWSHGLFYPFEILFLLVGLYQAFRLDKKKSFFLIALALVAPIPAAISTVGISYALRSSFLYPILYVFIAIGIYNLITSKLFTTWIRLGIVGLYIVGIGSFLHIYFIENPVNNSESFGFSNRVLSAYLHHAANTGTEVYFIGNNVANIYRPYIFYNNLMSFSSVSMIQESIRERHYKLGSITFLECPEDTPQGLSNKTFITMAGKVCPSITRFRNTLNPVVIAQLGDSGRIYEIYNDTVCSTYELSEYQPLITFDDLVVERLSVEKFCKTYISQPKPTI